MFGVPRAGSSLVTLFAFTAFVRALHRIASAPRTQVRKARSSPTAATDAMLGAAAVRETIDRVAGAPSRNTSNATALIVVAVLVHAFRPTVQGSLRAVRVSVRDVRLEARIVRAAIRRYGD